MSRIVDIEPLLKKYDGMNEGTEFSPIHFINDLMSLEQQPIWIPIKTRPMTEEEKEETLIHEMVHGMLVHLGYSEQSEDETFVQGLANAIYQGFEIKEWSGGNEKDQM